MMTIRVGRAVVMAAVMWFAVGVAQTTPYLGLPFEPKPVFLDCYDQAKWDGKHFIKTGKTICLADDPRGR